MLRSCRDALLSRLLSSRATGRRHQRFREGSSTWGMLARLGLPNSQRRSSAAARSDHPLADVWLLPPCHQASSISPGFAPAVSSQTRFRPRAASGVRLGSAHCRALETRLDLWLCSKSRSQNRPPNAAILRIIYEVLSPQVTASSVFDPCSSVADHRSKLPTNTDETQNTSDRRRPSAIIGFLANARIDSWAHSTE